MSLLRAVALFLALTAIPAVASDWGVSFGVGPRYSYPRYRTYYSTPYYSSRYYYSTPYYSTPYYYSDPYYYDRYYAPSLNFSFGNRYHRYRHW
jgi:hypothetical protein